MNLTAEKFEQLILRALNELGISGYIIVTFDVDEKLTLWCSTVSTPNGLKHVYIDFDREIDEGLVMSEIRQQLTAADNTAPEPTDETAREIPTSRVDPAHDDATQEAKRDAKVEELENRARNIVERVRQHERRKRGKPKR
jgi:hypothetical protein